MELISREAAIEAIDELVSTMSVCVSKDECRGMNGMKQRAIAAIRNLPTAEKVGKWIHDGKRFESGNDWWHCSECGYTDVLNRHNLPNYCPNCGARMVEGEEDEAD